MCTYTIFRPIEVYNAALYEKTEQNWDEYERLLNLYKEMISYVNKNYRI